MPAGPGLDIGTLRNDAVCLGGQGLQGGRRGHAYFLGTYSCHNRSGYTLNTITLPTKVRLVKAPVLPVVMYGCESWTIKKAEH